MKVVYLAGPMSNLPDFNYPAFNAEATRLRSLGYEVENPADNPVQEDWAGYLRVALVQMLSCDAVVTLPGWEGSRGANLETHVARALGMPVVAADALVETMRQLGEQR